MLFSSYIFLFVFLPVTLVGFGLLSRWFGSRPAKAWLILTSLFSYTLNDKLCAAKFKDAKEFDAEMPMTQLVWLTSIISVAVTFVASYLLYARRDIPAVS